MLIQHAGAAPKIDAGAYVAPNAVVCGNVTIGPGCRIMYGAQVIAESGSISIGRECIVMENAVLRSSARHPLNIGNNCLVGPQAHVVGCTLEDEVFIATGTAIFHSAHLARRLAMDATVFPGRDSERSAKGTRPAGIRQTSAESLFPSLTQRAAEQPQLNRAATSKLASRATCADGAGQRVLNRTV